MWYAISETENDTAEISLYDEIGGFGVGAKQFLGELSRLKGKHLHLRINSPGGSVVEGTAIFNALRRHQGGVTVHIDALAASMASVIAMAGMPVYMADNALLMVHNPWTITAGDSDELRKEADLLDKLKASIRNAYQRKTGLPEDQLQDMMDAETWLDSVDAVALGFVDAIEEGVAAAATVKPAELRARFDKYARGMDANTTPATEPKIISKEQDGEAVSRLAHNQEVDGSNPSPATTPADLGQQLPDGTPIVPAPEAPEAEVPVVEEPAPEEPAEEPEGEPAETLPDMPQASVGNAMLDAVAALNNRLQAMEARAMAAEARVVIAEAEARQHAEDHDRLARSLGIASASVIPELNTAAGDKPSLLEEYNAITDPAERSAFYRKHRAELVKLMTVAK
jgi:ATP-dependent Clp protease protease subunit